MIRNIKDGRAWMYEKNSRVTYIKFHEEEYTTGVLNALLDSSVVFGSDTVLLKDIAGVRKKNPIHIVARIAGLPVMLIGSIFMGDAFAIMYSDRHSDSGTKLFLLGAGIFALGYLPFQLNMKDLTVGFEGEWRIEICRKCLPQ